MKKKIILSVDSEDSESSDSEVEDINVKLKNELVFLKNPDKALDVDFVKGDSNIRFALPFRGIIAGQVNSGKSTMAINIILQRQAKKPKFDEIHIIHGCIGTQEYDCIQPTSIRHKIPNYMDFPHDRRILLVFDDVEFTKINKEDLRNLSQIVRMGSHCGMSMLFVNQLFIRIPKNIRDNCNVFVLYRPIDLDSLALIGRRISLTKDKVNYIYDNLLPEFHDSLCINLSKHCPFKYSKNLFEKIEI